MPFDSLGYLPTPTPAVTEPREAWRDVLMRAADYIETHGWCQRRLQDENGRVCARGAFVKVTTGADTIIGWSDAADLADTMLGDFLGQHVVEWNNDEGRTAAEVCAALRSCAQEPADA